MDDISIQQEYYIEYCEGDSNVLAVTFENNNICVYCLDLIVETYFPHEYKTYEVKFFLL